MPDYTTTALLASIRRRASVPNSSKLGTSDADLLAIATEELQGLVTALLVSTREEHLVTTYDVTLTAGTNAYNLPARAIAGALRDAVVVQTDGNLRNLKWLDRADLPGLDQSTGTPSRFYFQGDQVVLWPTPDASTETLRLPYRRRCGNLVAASAAWPIDALASATSFEFAATKPSAFATSQRFDIISAKPGFRTLAMDLTASIVAPDAMSFTTTLPDDVEVGDYVCLAGESPVPQVPVELHPLLAQAAAVQVLKYTNPDKVGAALSDLKALKDDVVGLLTPRNDGEPVPWISGTAFFGGY